MDNSKRITRAAVEAAYKETDLKQTARGVGECLYPTMASPLMVLIVARKGVAQGVALELPDLHQIAEALSLSWAYTVGFIDGFQNYQVGEDLARLTDYSEGLEDGQKISPLLTGS